VAAVAGTPISRKSYLHWLGVEEKLGATGDPGHLALGFLLTSEWVRGEAAARHISITEFEVKQYLAKLEKRTFPKAGAFRAFLSSSGETEADLLARARVELLKSRTAAQVTSGETAAQSRTALIRFEGEFLRHWRSYTTCKSGYVMEDCSEYRGRGERSPSGSPIPTPGGTHGNRNVQPPGGGSMTLTSSALEPNGSLPARYTCDGSAVSPPLRWQKVPANAAALVLIVIDDNGIRWMVGDINPKSTSVAEGRTPDGGIVGSSVHGQVGYEGICPPHGKTTTVEFALYALRKKIALSSGYLPKIAEAEYGSNRLALAPATILIAKYHRP
jgi:phosphatidylethanolamine-binding protein (PEBP) family uncharacterized protein